MSGQVDLDAWAGTEGGGAIALKVLKTLEYARGEDGGGVWGGVWFYLFMGYFVHLYILPLLKFKIIGKTGWQQCHLILKKKSIQGHCIPPIFYCNFPSYFL